MTGPDLEQIHLRVVDCATYNFGMRSADQLAHVDAPALLAEVDRLRGVIGATSSRVKFLLSRVGAVTAENTQLRAALDELNAETETLFNDAGQEGIEKAKTWALRANQESIRRLKTRPRRGGGGR